MESAPRRIVQPGLTKRMTKKPQSFRIRSETKKGAEFLLPFSPSNFDSIALVRDARRTLAGSVSLEAAAASCIDANHGIFNRTEALGAG